MTLLLGALGLGVGVVFGLELDRTAASLDVWAAVMPAVGFGAMVGLAAILALTGTFVLLARPASGAGPGLLAVSAGLLLGAILGLLLGPAAPPEPPIHDPGPLPSWLR